MKRDFGECVATDDGTYTMRHPEHGECYHARQGAMAEARELYINGSGILAALSGEEPLTVLDVGLGLAYNAVATLAAWCAAAKPPVLEMLSLEIDPGLVEALARGDGPWQANWSEAQLAFGRSLHKVCEGEYRGAITHRAAPVLATWRILIGDAVHAPLPAPTGGSGWQYVWQDPFSPEKNPSMWGDAWFKKLYPVCAPGCVVMSYSVARTVRDALAAAHFAAARYPAPVGHKRHWLRATKAASPAAAPQPPKQ